MVYLVPLQESDWSPTLAAHLAWRTGFGERLEFHEELGLKGLARAVDYYLSQLDGESEFGRWFADEWKDEREKGEIIDELRKKIKTTTDPKERKTQEMERERLQQELNRLRDKNLSEFNLEWISRLCTTQKAFPQKLILFWHNHFSISGEKVSAHLMVSYLDLLLSKGLGHWGELLLTIAKHPAMLIHLDNLNNVKGHANENFARELMELFSLGVGHYSEVDVQQSARAFTGWSVDRKTDQFIFRQERHDEGIKIFLGKEGNWNGENIVAMILEHPQAARFLAFKIWTYFAYEDPEEELIVELAQVIRKSQFDLKAIFKAVFQSKAFYSVKARGTQVKSPVQLVMGSLRFLEMEKFNPRIVGRTLKLMGMELVRPPDVNGWPSGFRWVNTSTLLLRYNFMNLVINGRLPSELQEGRRSEAESSFDPMKLVEGRSFSTASDVADYFLAYFIQRPLQSDLRNQLVKYLETDRSGGSSTFDLKHRLAGEKMKGLIHLILSAPDYQLC